MGVPRSRSSEHERLLVEVETATASSRFELDQRLLVEEIVEGCDGAVGRAVVSIRLDDEHDAFSIRQRYPSDRRMRITTEHEQPSFREVLFDGYPQVATAEWDGRRGGAGETCRLTLEHALARLSRTPECWVYGRQVRSGAIEAARELDPAAYAAASVRITALPCVFNPAGVPNRAIEPITVTDQGDTIRTVPVFSWEGGPAVAWTFADVLRYLVWFHLGRGPVNCGNVFEATEGLAVGRPDAGHLAVALARVPISLGCEAVSLVEALSLLADAAGVHISTRTVRQGVQTHTELQVWSPHDGALKHLHLARGGRFADGEPRYNPRIRSVSDVLAENNTHRGRIRWDDGAIVSRVNVLGDVKRYELTLPLVPGWLPTAGLDDVPAGEQEQVKLAALTPEQVAALGDQADQNAWFRRYHRGGSEYNNHADVGRLWVLNEDGACAGAAFNRNPPFNDYRPFDFGTVFEDPQVGRDWMRRARPLRSCVSLGADGQPLGVWVQVSFNGGATWYVAAGPVSVIERRAGIHFDCDNLTSITPTGVAPAVQNLWYATVRQTFRVRVTAVIESDERLAGTWGPAGLDSPTRLTNAVVLRRPEVFGYLSREAADNVLAASSPAGPEARDDAAVIQAAARHLAEANQDRTVAAAPALPWIETGYRVGDRLGGIAGREVSFAVNVGGRPRYPAIVERRFVLTGGHYETVLGLGVGRPADGLVGQVGE